MNHNTIDLSTIKLTLKYVCFQLDNRGKQITLEDVLKLPFEKRCYLSFFEELEPERHVIHFFWSQQYDIYLEYILETDDLLYFYRIRKAYYAKLNQTHSSES